MNELYRLHDNIGFYINFTARTMKNAMTKTFHDHGYEITADQWPVLAMLWYKDGRPQKEITDEAYREKTMMTRLIDSLEKKNLILRIPDSKDKRNNLIYLTNEGKELQAKLMPLVIGLEEAAVEGISEKDLKCTMDILLRIYENLTKNV